MQQQTLTVLRVSDGVFMSENRMHTIRELGDHDALQVYSSRLGREWIVPWNRETQCFQLSTPEFNFEVEATGHDSKGATTKYWVVVQMN